MEEAASCPICAGALRATPISSFDRLHGGSARYAVACCSNCRAGVTTPLVDEDQLGAFYPDSYGPYDEQMSPVARPISRAIRRYQGWRALRTPPLTALRSRPAGTAVDIGCGRGDLAVALASQGWRMIGIEPSPQACRAAAARGIDARCGTLRTVALEAVDAAVFNHSLEHVAEPLVALRTTAEALVPGGLVLITVPNFGGWQARRFRGRWYHLDLPRHRVHFTPEALRQALTRAGLEPLELRTSTSAVGLPASIQYALAGRCLFPSGTGLRIASALCVLVQPIARLCDRIAGGGDLLHAVALKPS